MVSSNINGTGGITPSQFFTRALAYRYEGIESNQSDLINCLDLIRLLLHVQKLLLFGEESGAVTMLFPLEMGCHCASQNYFGKIPSWKQIVLSKVYTTLVGDKRHVWHKGKGKRKVLILVFPFTYVLLKCLYHVCIYFFSLFFASLLLA